MISYSFKGNTFSIYDNQNLKVDVPEIIYYNVNRWNFNDVRCYKKDNDFFFVNYGSKSVIYNVEEFKLNIMNIIKLCKCSSLGNDFINQIKDDINSDVFINECKKNSINGLISDCLFYNINYSITRPFSTESNYLLYDARSSVDIHNPASSQVAVYNRYENTEPVISYVDNKKNKNFALPWEPLTQKVELEDVETAHNILLDLYEISNGERLEYTNLIFDYIFAMLFKHNAYHKQLNWHLFPILLITGTKASGKSTLVKTLCNFFWNKEDDFFYNSSKLEGANLLTRFHNLHALNVLPIVLDDLQDISVYTKMINPTLTQGFITEEIGSTSGKNITRKMFNTIIITANNISIMQGGGSDAAADRFLEVNIIEQPLNNIESKKKFDKFLRHSGYLNTVGTVILNLAKKNSSKILENEELPDFVWSLDNRKIDYIKMLMFGDKIRRVVMSEINGADGCFTENVNFEKYFLGDKHKTNITKNSDVMYDALLSLMNENIYIQGKYYNLKQFIISSEYLSGSQTLVQSDEMFNQLLSNLGLYQATTSKTEFGESGQFVTTGLFIKRMKDNIYKNNHKQFTITTEMLAKELPQYFEKLVSINYYQRHESKPLCNKKLATYTLRFNAMQFLIDNKLIDDETIENIKKWHQFEE